MTFSVGPHASGSPVAFDSSNGRQFWPVRIAALSALLVCSCLLVACQSADNSAALGTAASSRTAADTFSLHVSEQSIYDSAQFNLSVVTEAEAAVVSLEVNNASGLKAAYIDLAYDPEQWQPADSGASGLLAGDDAQLLELSIADQTGVVTHGQVLADWPECDGFSGDGVLATFRFAPPGTVASPDRNDGRSAAIVPDSDKAAHYLNYNGKSSVFLWYYVNPGDYDQNGEVGITDLTPLGANFNDEGPFAVTDVRSVVDGDGNDVINIADITPIGVNFGNRIDSFAVYGGGGAGDFPDANTGPNGPGARMIGTRPFSASNGGGALRKYWELVMDRPVVGEGYYWLRPVLAGSDGTPSQQLHHTQQWHTTEVYDVEPVGQPRTFQGHSLATVDGKPALLVLSRQYGGDLMYFHYVSAKDSVGSAWNPAISVLTLQAGQSAPYLAEINGAPAFCWRDDFSVGGLRYIRALDADGSIWDQPVTVDTIMDAGLVSRLVEYDGKPAAIFIDGGQTASICLAADAEGASWQPRVPVYSGTSDTRLSAAAVPGGIGVVVDNDSTGTLVYKMLEIDGLGVSVKDDVTMFTEGVDSNAYLHIGISGDMPYAISLRGGQKALYSTYALDSEGSGWTNPSELSLGGPVVAGAAVTAYGVPWVCYMDQGTDEYRSAYAEAPQSTTWINVDIVLDSFVNHSTPVMGQAGVHPCVAYLNISDSLIRFAAYY
jgi:hypothetical protein